MSEGNTSQNCEKERGSSRRSWRGTLKDVKEEVDLDSAEGFIGKEEAIKVLDEEVDEFKAEIEDDASVEGCSRVLHFSFCLLR